MQQANPAAEDPVLAVLVELEGALNSTRLADSQVSFRTRLLSRVVGADATDTPSKSERRRSEALGLLTVVSTGTMFICGVTVLVVGGILSLGFGGLLITLLLAVTLPAALFRYDRAVINAVDVSVDLEQSRPLISWEPTAGEDVEVARRELRMRTYRVLYPARSARPPAVPLIRQAISLLIAAVTTLAFATAAFTSRHEIVPPRHTAASVQQQLTAIQPRLATAEHRRSARLARAQRDVKTLRFLVREAGFAAGRCPAAQRHCTRVLVALRKAKMRIVRWRQPLARNGARAERELLAQVAALTREVRQLKTNSITAARRTRAVGDRLKDLASHASRLEIWLVSLSFLIVLLGVDLGTLRLRHARLGESELRRVQRARLRKFTTLRREFIASRDL